MNTFIDQLCPNCGFCCNGNLFADVELQKGDDALRLKKLGLSLEPRSRGKLAFAQPCACFDGTLCTVYPDRPKRCRTFECGLLQKVERGNLNVAAALKSITQSRVLVKKVVEQLRLFGPLDDRLPLTKRYSQAMSRPIDLTKGASDSKMRGKLMLAMELLMRQLEEDFLK